MATTKPTFTTNTHTANTLNDLLARIKNYVSLLRTQAAYLGDTVASGKLKEISENINSTDTTKIPNLAAITEALLTITNQNPKLGENTITLGTDTKISGTSTAQVIKIPVGFYGVETTFTIESLGDSSKVDNPPTQDEVVKDKEYWVNGVKYTGSLVDNSGKTVNADSSTAATATEGQTITIKVPTAKYDSNSVIDTGIVARNPVGARDTTTGKINGIDVATDGTYKPIVKQTTDAEGSETFTVQAVEIPSGYYKDPIKVMPVFEDGNTIENVINTTTKDITIDHSTDDDHKWEYAPAADNADYYTSIKVNVAQAALSKATLTPTLSSTDNTATVVVPVTTAGYTDAGSYTVNLQTATPVTGKDETAKTDASADGLVITPEVANAQSVAVPAGLYTADTVIKINPMTSGTILDKDDITLNTVPDTLTDNKYSVSVKVGESGYIAEGDYEVGTLTPTVIKVGATSAAATEAGDTGTISTQSIVVKVEEGYTKGLSTTLTVQDATIAQLTSSKASGNNNASLIITTGTNGWFDGDSVELSQTAVKTLVDGLTTVEEVTYSTNNTVTLNNTAGAVVIATDGSYYNKVDMSTLLDELTNL